MKTKIILALLFGASLATAATAQQNAPPTKLRMAYDGYSMTSAPLNASAR